MTDSSRSDFRSIRAKLPPESFAIHPDGPEPPPSDLVEKDVWDAITWLTDDVSIRTSDEFGSELKAMIDIWGSAVDMSEHHGDAWFHTVLDIADNLQAAIFNALCGYYRVSGSCLRTAVEYSVIGAFLQLERAESDAIRWQKGQIEVTFSSACDNLHGHASVRPLESHLRSIHKQTLFQQKSNRMAPGWIRFVFGELSEFSHARPSHSDASMWDGSNGPIFVSGSFGRIYSMYLNAAFAMFVLAKMARPTMEMPSSAARIFHSKRVKISEFMKTCFEFVYGRIP